MKQICDPSIEKYILCDEIKKPTALHYEFWSGMGGGGCC
jgi:hypothetical protein